MEGAASHSSYSSQSLALVPGAKRKGQGNHRIPPLFLPLAGLLPPALAPAPFLLDPARSLPPVPAWLCAPHLALTPLPPQALQQPR